MVDYPTHTYMHTLIAKRRCHNPNKGTCDLKRKSQQSHSVPYLHLTCIFVDINTHPMATESRTASYVHRHPSSIFIPLLNLTSLSPPSPQHPPPAAASRGPPRPPITRPSPPSLRTPPPSSLKTPPPPPPPLFGLAERVLATRRANTQSVESGSVDCPQKFRCRGISRRRCQCVRYYCVHHSLLEKSTFSSASTVGTPSKALRPGRGQRRTREERGEERDVTGFETSERGI